jgi:hypothetical protein
MANTVKAATGKITISVEHPSLGGAIKHVQTIASVVEVAHRHMEIGLTEIEVMAFQATDPGPGTFDEADVRFILIINHDDTNFIQLTFKNESNDECVHKLEKGSFMVISVSDEGVVNIHDAENGAITTVTFADLVNITGLADTAACDIEYVVFGV